MLLGLDDELTDCEEPCDSPLMGNESNLKRGANDLYNKILSRTIAERKDDPLSSLEVRGILKRNNVPHTGYVSKYVLEDIADAKRFLRLAHISSPVFDIHTE